MASPEIPRPQESGEIPPSGKTMKDLTHSEMLAKIGSISVGLREDREERLRKVREDLDKEGMKRKIQEYREKFGDDAAALTDEDIRLIITESEERRGGSPVN